MGRAAGTTPASYRRSSMLRQKHCRDEEGDDGHRNEKAGDADTLRSHDTGWESETCRLRFLTEYACGPSVPNSYTDRSPRKIPLPCTSAPSAHQLFPSPKQYGIIVGSIHSRAELAPPFTAGIIDSGGIDLSPPRFFPRGWNAGGGFTSLWVPFTLSFLSFWGERERERWVDSSVVLDLGMGGCGCRPRVGVGRTNAGTGAKEGVSGASRRGVGRRLAWTVVSFICTIYFMYYLLSIQSAESLHNCSTPLHIHSALSHQRRRILSEAQIAPLGRRRLHPRRSSFPRPRIISKRPRHSSSTWLGRPPLSRPPAMPALSRCRRQRYH